MRRLIALLTLAAAVPASTAAAADPRVDRFLQAQAAAGFSGAVLAVWHGRVVVDRGYGLADRRRGIPVTSRTVFDVGSITKVFTAATVVRLAEEGRLRLDDRLTRFLPSIPADKRSITLRQLLGHRSGLPLMPLRPLADVSRDQAVREALALPLLHRPGARKSYSNVGYALLAAVIERASGVTYESALRGRVFRPAGMTRTGFAGESRWRARDVAIGYGNQRRAGRNAPDTYSIKWPLKGAGGVASTTRDLAAWVAAVHAGRIVRKANVAELYRLAIGPTPPGLPPEHGYGGATSFGFNADVEERPREPGLVIVLTNANLLPRERATEVAEGVVERLRA
jgi:CubicO group peptidase (beta-lactamase class C family)